MATYEDKAMVVLDAPPPPEDGKRKRKESWYDCSMGDVARPAPREEGGDVFDPPPLTPSEKRRRNRKRRREGGGDPSPPEEEDDPRSQRVGLNRLIQHPQWLSHDCPVPCQGSHDYAKWNDLRNRNDGEVACRNDNDRQATVFVVGVENVHEHFQRRWAGKGGGMTTRGGPSYDDAAHAWALRLGAHGHEARTFAGLRDGGGDDVWGYVAALMARSGIVRFQPWIAQDVKARIRSTGVPLYSPYAAISAYRRGGGGNDGEGGGGGGGGGGVATGSSSTRRPRDLLAYFQRLESDGCGAQPVYIATDDPGWVQDEIDRFLGASDCRNVRFILGRVDDDPAGDDAIADAGKADCSRLHRAKIATFADLMILSKSETYLGGSDYSDVDWLVRIFRTSVNSPPDTMHATSCYG